MINVIISHDVDHLFSKDHWFRDFIYPKMWIRTTIQMLKREITSKEWWLRNSSAFRTNRHNLGTLMKFDMAYGIESTFFFGMNQGLGMSYKPEEAKPIIEYVYKNGFDVGIHGIDYQSFTRMKKEYDRFKSLFEFDPYGIRMHYVRFNDSTFAKLEKIGYLFDTTEFDKKKCYTKKSPYKIGKMWEFPLTIMDGYLPQKFEEAKKTTLQILEDCKNDNIKYITVLFHDYQFCNDYKDIRAWYVWLMDYFSKSPEYQFISYSKAIEQLEKQGERINID